MIDKEEDIVYEFDNDSVAKRMEILEAIPSEIYSEITEYTKKVRDVENQLLTIEVDGVKHTLDISVELFTP